MKIGFTVNDCMTSKPITVNITAIAHDCAKIMAKENVGSLIILKEKEIAGIVTEEDLIRKVMLKEKNSKKTLVKDIMTKDIVSIEPGNDIFDALTMMRDNDIRQLPVIDCGKLRGVITLQDILKVEPQLFDLIVENISLKEENFKPINEVVEKEGICQLCGKLSHSIREVSGSRICPRCSRHN